MQSNSQSTNVSASTSSFYTRKISFLHKLVTILKKGLLYKIVGTYSLKNSLCFIVFFLLFNSSLLTSAVFVYSKFFVCFYFPLRIFFESLLWNVLFCCLGSVWSRLFIGGSAVESFLAMTMSILYTPMFIFLSLVLEKSPRSAMIINMFIMSFYILFFHIYNYTLPTTVNFFIFAMPFSVLVIIYNLWSLMRLVVMLRGGIKLDNLQYSS